MRAAGADPAVLVQNRYPTRPKANVQAVSRSCGTSHPHRHAPCAWLIPAQTQFAEKNIRRIEAASSSLPICMGMPINNRQLGEITPLLEAQFFAPELGDLVDALDFRRIRLFRAPSPLDDAYTIMISAMVHGCTSMATIAVCLPLSMCVRQGAFTLTNTNSVISFDCDLSHIRLPDCTMVFDFGVLARRLKRDSTGATWLIQIDRWHLKARIA